MAVAEVTGGCCRGQWWLLQRSLVVAATHQGSHSSVECPNIPVITEVKVTTQKNGERTLSMRNSNEKKKKPTQLKFKFISPRITKKLPLLGYPKTQN